MWKVLLVSWFVGICSSVVSCPHHCECYIEDEGLHTANCSGSALTTHQQIDQIDQIDILNVRPHFKAFRTKLSPRGFKNFKNIKFLNLSNTSIYILPNEVFNGLHYIITIDLSYNKIKRLNGGVFKELSTLQTLLLRGNPLILTPSDVIVSKSLRKLDLGNCGLHSIPQFTFEHVTSLTALFLDGNFIQTVGYNTVPSGVSYLNLANNHIVHVPTDVLHTMRSLNRLDMSGNPVKCTCQLLLLQDTFSGQGRIFENDVVCSSPRQFHGQKLSQINENDLCNLEFIKKERYMNSIKHFRDVRSYRKHNMIKPPYDENFGIQGDQPREMMMSDEIAPTHDFEVMFSNDDTRSMGTHMATNTFTSHHPDLLDISDENNKLSDSKQNQPITDSSTEVEIISKEQEDPPEDLKMPDEETTDFDDVINTNNSSKTDIHSKDIESIEDFNDNESSPMMEQEIFSTEKTEEKISEVSPVEKENNKPEELSTSSIESEIPESVNRESSHLISSSNHTDDASSTKSKEDFSEVTEPSIIHDKEELTSSQSHKDTNDPLSRYLDTNVTSDSEDVEETRLLTSSLDDVEVLKTDSHNFTDDPPMSRYSHVHLDHSTEFTETSMSSLDDIFSEPFTTQRPNRESYTFPTSKSDMTDYNYDAQHDDYSSVEPWIGGVINSTDDNTSEGTNIPLTTEMYIGQEKSTTERTASSSVSYSLETEEEEGSGEPLNETLSEEGKSSVMWMEEQENETTTEYNLVEIHSNVSFNFTSDEGPLSHYISENASSIETRDIEETTEVSTEMTNVSSEAEPEVEISTDVVSTSDETTTEEIMTTIESTSEDTSLVEVSSEETTASSMDNETQTVTPEEEEEEETTYPTTEETTIEPLISLQEGSSSTDSSSTASDISSSSTYSSSIEITSERIIEVSPTSEEATTEVTETSTDTSPIPFVIPEESEEEEKDDVSSTAATITSEHSVIDVSSSVEEHSSTSESTDLSSSTPMSEIEFVSKSIHIDEKENIILDPTKEEISKSEQKTDAPDLAMIAIVAIILLILIIIIVVGLAVVCRRTKRPKNKIRLPADPEANLGTEMQDMLLPKPPENGVKVVPKNYTNGTTTTNGSNKPEQKEEETPVLSAEPEPSLQEPDWEDKPEPIETVTARLTMLARPQTPVYIPNTLN